MDRREFLARLGIVSTGLALLGSGGCGRLLRWSADQDQIKVREITPLPDEKSTATIPTSTGLPDLSVITGNDPAALTREAVKRVGGIGRFVKNGNQVVIKPNLLTARAPEYAATTNPIVVGTLVSMCLEAGAAKVTVLDNPTSPPAQTYEISGIAEATRKAGGDIKILTDRNFETISIPEGRAIKSFPLVVDIFEADVFINVPIAKTHGMAGLTMAMKNLMGIMGQGRPGVHQDFDQKIVDLNTLVKPHLVILDAYRILTRNGPSGGNLSDVKMAKTVIAGTNQASVDAFGTTLFGWNPDDLGYLVNAKNRGLGETELSKLIIDRVATG